jgi:hypothetical protein
MINLSASRQEGKFLVPGLPRVSGKLPTCKTSAAGVLQRYQGIPRMVRDRSTACPFLKSFLKIKSPLPLGWFIYPPNLGLGKALARNKSFSRFFILP